MIDTLRSLIRGGTREVLLECRDCGTAVEGGGDCPCCGSEDIARYVIE